MIYIFVCLNIKGGVVL